MGFHVLVKSLRRKQIEKKHTKNVSMGIRFCGWVHVNAICIPPVYVKKGVGTP